MTDPILTVAMPVYNGQKYLGEAIDTILAQTFDDFEFLIVDDGSTDNSLEIIKSYSDRRIRVISNSQNFGIAYTRNIALQEARGLYLAWTDCDDINYPSRLQTQIDFLEQNKSYGLCGTWMHRWEQKSIRVAKSKLDPEVIKGTLLFRPAIWNATAMYRLDKIREFKLKFNTALPIAEDYEFYLKGSMYFPMINIPKVLYKYRSSDTSIMNHYASRISDSSRIHNIVYQEALSYLNITPSPVELRLHSLLSSSTLFESFNDFRSCGRWLIVLKEKNRKKCLYEHSAFNKVLADQFFFISKKASRFGMKTLFCYLRVAARHFRFTHPFHILKLAVRCAIKYNKF